MNIFFFYTGYSDNKIKSIKSLDNGNYLLNEHELKIISLWLCFDSSLFNDIIIIEVESLEPYEVGEKNAHLSQLLTAILFLILQLLNQVL